MGLFRATPPGSVSYTHLDVYKRQVFLRDRRCPPDHTSMKWLSRIAQNRRIAEQREVLRHNDELCTLRRGPADEVAGSHEVLLAVVRRCALYGCRAHGLLERYRDQRAIAAVAPGLPGFTGFAWDLPGFTGLRPGRANCLCSSGPEWF